MAFNLKSIQKNTAFAAPRIMLYGVEGIGKTTFAAGAPAPIFICTEDGLGSLQVDHFPLAKKAGDVLDAIGSLITEDHGFGTVVLDSVDWLDNMIWADVESTHDAKDLAYGKGAMIVADRWREVLAGLNTLRNDKGMVVILIAHTQIKRFDSPEVEPYDRYQPKLQERSNAILREWADAVFFANYKTIVKKDDVGFNKTTNRGISTGERLLFTSERPAYMAKNRYNLKESLPMSWESFAQAIA
ncbi:AAA domain containing protein [uncultured Caudovirales phage]|uniref:AAA domain containing protein n=1 Tax=uncultured Caudovirales phage TaxID=2100421 RepID=A0A6J5N1B0_9CAUD|nr:AAA domain containing protein [uncultured Caudovirales phage]